MEARPVADINAALLRPQFPTVVMWNRLEGRPRTHLFDRALKAEVRDALWMLTKQWQMGEFTADDAGSPVFAKIHISSRQLTTYQAADHAAQAFEPHVPLEVKAEQKKISFVRGGKNTSIDIRLQMGKYWLKLLRKNALDYSHAYVQQYTFHLPANNRTTDYLYAHKEVWQQYAAISGRSMDGYQLYEHLAVPGNSAADGITSLDPDKTALETAGTEFKSWYERMYYQPADENNNAWLPDRLEYSFTCTAPDATGGRQLLAEEYYQGSLDWHAFNIEQQPQNSLPGPVQPFTNTFIPAHVQFGGMPDTRWWKFEDGKTSLGNITPSTTDVAKLLLMEFGLVFANDWFLVPCKLPVGSLANIEGLAVKNNFGETTWINAAEEAGAAGNTWSMFKLHSSKQNNTLFLAPAAVKVHEGDPLEEVLLVRDEISNMVWGIETTVPLPTGQGDRGGETAIRTRQFHERIVAGSGVPDPVPYASTIYYQAMTDVPENWIPFVPVHIKNNTRETQLQRASMLRTIEGDPDAPVKIKPLTSILREGLEAQPDPLPYYIHEEEVPRAGIKVSQAFQRTRWMNGEVFVWLGMKKKIGRGEGSSGLAFDQVADAPPVS